MHPLPTHTYLWVSLSIVLAPLGGLVLVAEPVAAAIVPFEAFADPGLEGLVGDDFELYYDGAQLETGTVHLGAQAVDLAKGGAEAQPWHALGLVLLRPVSDSVQFDQLDTFEFFYHVPSGVPAGWSAKFVYYISLDADDDGDRDFCVLHSGEPPLTGTAGWTSITFTTSTLYSVSPDDCPGAPDTTALSTLQADPLYEHTTVLSVALETVVNQLDPYPAGAPILVDTFSLTALNDEPVASFTLDPPVPVTPLTRMTATSTSTDSDGEIVLEEWRVRLINDPTPDGIADTPGVYLTGVGPIYDFRFPDDGLWRVILKVTDDDGGTDQTAITLNVDNAPPVAAIDVDQFMGGHRDHDDQPVAIRSGHHARVMDVSQDLDGAIASSALDLDGVPGFETAISPGDHVMMTWTAACEDLTVGVEVTDDEGETASAFLDLVIDGGDPVITTSAPAPDGDNGWFVTSPVIVSYAVSDDCTGIEYVSARDGNGDVVMAARPPGSGTLSFDEDGARTVAFETRDLAHNEVSSTEIIRVDTTPPDVDVTSPCLPLAGCALGLGGVALAGDQVDIECNAADATSGLAAVDTFVDGVLIGSGDCTSPVPWTAAGQGLHTIEVVASDVAGNVATAAVDLLVLG